MTNNHWHEQGSGVKFYYTTSIVVITDRNDLDDQLYGQFARCKDFLRQTPQHAESRK